MSEQIKINDGMKTYDIVNQDGKYLGQFSFNPMDTGMVKRYEEVAKELSLLVQSMAKEEENTDTVALLEEIDRIAHEKINYMLNADVAGTFFKIMGPFTLMESGQFFIEVVVNAIASIIQNETVARPAKIEQKIKKYTAKYHK